MNDNLKLLEILKDGIKTSEKIDEMRMYEIENNNGKKNYEDISNLYFQTNNKVAVLIMKKIMERVKTNKRKLATLNRVLDKIAETNDNVRLFALAELIIYDDGMLLTLSTNSKNKFEVFVNNSFEIKNMPKEVNSILCIFYEMGYKIMNTCEEWGLIGEKESEDL